LYGICRAIWWQILDMAGDKSRKALARWSVGLGISWPLTKAFGSLRSAPPWPRPITFAAFAYRLGSLGDLPEWLSVGFFLQDSMNETQKRNFGLAFRGTPVVALRQWVVVRALSPLIR
jgi:hypothetical protein